jgi:hypothetical protein
MPLIGVWPIKYYFSSLPRINYKFISKCPEFNVSNSLHRERTVLSGLSKMVSFEYSSFFLHIYIRFLADETEGYYFHELGVMQSQ